MRIFCAGWRHMATDPVSASTEPPRPSFARMLHGASRGASLHHFHQCFIRGCLCHMILLPPKHRPRDGRCPLGGRGMKRARTGASLPPSRRLRRREGWAWQQDLRARFKTPRGRVAAGFGQSAALPKRGNPRSGLAPLRQRSRGPKPAQPSGRWPLSCLTAL